MGLSSLIGLEFVMLTVLGAIGLLGHQGRGKASRLHPTRPFPAPGRGQDAPPPRRTAAARRWFAQRPSPFAFGGKAGKPHQLRVHLAALLSPRWERPRALNGNPSADAGCTSTFGRRPPPGHHGNPSASQGPPAVRGPSRRAHGNPSAKPDGQIPRAKRIRPPLIRPPALRRPLRKRGQCGGPPCHRHLVFIFST